MIYRHFHEKDKNKRWPLQEIWKSIDEIHNDIDLIKFSILYSLNNLQLFFESIDKYGNDSFSYGYTFYLGQSQTSLANTNKIVIYQDQWIKYVSGNKHVILNIN